jgi:predicted  nucleic acid-binding Zn-ribbon protein
MNKLILLALLVSVSGCFNDLKRGKALRKEAFQSSSNALTVYSEMETGPDTLVAFFWPSEDFYDRHNGDYFSNSDYQEFITENSTSVFKSSDEFDVWMRKIFTQVPELREDAALIENEKGPVQEKIDALAKKMSDNKKEIKNLQKPFKKQIKKRDGYTKKLNSKKKELKKKQEELNQDPNNQEIKDAIAKIEAAITGYEEKLAPLNEELAEMDAQIAPLQAEIDELFVEKKRIQDEEMKPITDRLAENKKVQDKMNLWQKEMLNRIQAGIDPQSVTKVLDAEGNQVVNEFGIKETEIDSQKQLHWVQTYDPAGTPRDKSHVIFKDGVIDIRFGEWGLDKIDYRTKFEKTEEGEIKRDSAGKGILAKDSDFYDIELDAKDVLRFKIREKNRFGNRTRQGSYLEFTLQRSAFEGHMRLVGDMFRYTPGVAEPERGQAKIFLVKKDKAFLSCKTEAGAMYRAAREENREEFKAQCGQATIDGTLCFTGETMVAKALLEKYAKDSIVEVDGAQTTIPFFKDGFTLTNIKLIAKGKIAYDVLKPGAEANAEVPDYWTSAAITRCNQ